MILELLQESYSILHVEDHIGDADLVLELLRDCAPDAFRITHVGAVRKAVPLLREKRFDLILLDLSLPDAFGAESVDSLIELAPDTPIVVLSGMQCERLSQRSKRCGARAVLYKDHMNGPALQCALTQVIMESRV